MKKIFVLLLLMGLAFAADTTEENPYILEGIGMIISAIALVMAIIGIAFMLSKVFLNTRLEVWAKSEAFNLLISILIVALIPGLLLVTNTVIETSLEEDGVKRDPFEIAYIYLDDLSSVEGLETAQDLLIGSYENQFRATKYFFLGSLGIWGGAGKEYMADYISKSVHQEMLLNFAMLGVVSLTIQKLSNSYDLDFTDYDAGEYRVKCDAKAVSRIKVLFGDIGIAIRAIRKEDDVYVFCE